MNAAAQTPQTPDSAVPVPPIEGSYEAFRVFCMEFMRAADTADADELAAGVKFVGLAFRGIHWDDCHPLHKVRQAAGAPALMRLVTMKTIERETVLAMEEDAPGERCAP